MFCSSCNKSALLTTEHSLCDSCSIATPENRLDVRVVSEEVVAGRVQCEICLQEYQEDALDQHREMCIVRLIFRCAVCNWDYVSKEGLWNHLNLHEIANESKELHYQEVRVTQKLHQCILCNDQRGYQDSLYWKHVYDVHDGFFLRCSECGDCFRSQKLKGDHDLNHCKVREQTLPSDSGDLEVDPNFCNVKEQSIELNEERDIPAHKMGSRLSDPSLANLSVADGVDLRSEVHRNTTRTYKSATERIMQSPMETPSSRSSDSKCSHCGKEFSNDLFLASHIKFNHKPFACNICGITFSSFYLARYHKVTKHTESKHKCPHCPRTFHQKKVYELHLTRCEVMKFSCELCGQKFKSLQYVVQHMKRFHHNMGNLERTQSNRKGCNEEQKQTEDEQIVQNKTVSVEEASLLPSLEENPSSETSGTKCSHCGKQFSNVISLADHIESNHLPLECDICGIKFSRFSRVQYHKMMKHSERKLKCPHCPRIYHRTRDYQAHLSICETKKFSCELCHEKFTAPLYVARHMKRFHRVKGSLKKIQIDNLDSNEKQKLEETTMLLDSSGNPTSPDEETIDSLINRVDVDDMDNNMVEKKTNMLPTASMKGKTKIRATTGKDLQPLADNSSCKSSETRCSHCGKEFANAKSLFLHINRCHKPTKCNICGIYFAGVDNTRYHKIMKHTDPKYECGTCSKKFSQKTVYKFHTTICDGKRIPCKLCDLKFKTSKSHKMHMRRHHRDAKDSMNVQNDLPSCKKQLEQNNAENIALKMEIAVEETKLLQQDGKPPECPDLSRNAKDQEILNSKPFSFDQEITDSHWNEHSPAIMNAANDTDAVAILKDRSDTEGVSENPSNGASSTKCSICGEQLSSVISLSRHIESNHVPVERDICGITLPSALKAWCHKNTKHMEPEYKCHNCSMKFYKKIVYWKHVSICVSRRYPCELCGKKFKRLYCVNHHKRRVHHVNEALRKVEIDLISQNIEQEQKQAEQIYPKWGITTEKTRTLKQTDQVKSTSTPSKIIDCPYLRSYAENQEVVNSEPLSLNCRAQSSALTQRTIPDKELDIYSAQALTSPDQETVDSQWDENSRESFTGSDDSDNIIEILPIASSAGWSETAVVAETAVVENSSRRSSGKKCSHCGKECLNVTALARHIRKNHRPHACGICGITFSNSMKAQYHKITRHTEPKHKCRHCPKKFHQEYSYRRHLLQCEQRKYSCEFCDQKFRSITNFARHMRRDHQVDGYEGQYKNQADNINCPIGGETFDDHNLVSRQVEGIHPMTMCTSCGINFTSVDQLYVHKLTCPNHLKYVDSQYIVEEISLPNSEDSSSESPNTVCPHCDKDYYDKAFLALHIVKCHQSVACDICGVFFSGKNQLWYHRHYKVCHAKDVQTDRTGCHELEKELQPCGNKLKPLVENIDLNMEIKVEETTLQEQEFQAADDDCGNSSITTTTGASQLIGVKPREISKFTCNKCHQTFYGVGVFQKHIMIHTNEGKFRCKICDRQLKNRRLLQNHMETEHNYSMIPEVKQFICQICGESVSSFTELRYHKMTFHTEPDDYLEPHQHSSLQNPDSEEIGHGNEINIKEERLDDETLMPPQSSTESSQYHNIFSNRNVSHVHHGADDQMRVCSICGLIFGNKRKLHYHKLMSHTEPKYQCTHCPLMFHLKNIRRRHEKVHNKTKIRANNVSMATCKLCSKTFRDKWVLQRHIDRFHLQSELLSMKSEKKQFTCSICGESVSSFTKLRYHKMKFHTEHDLVQHQSLSHQNVDSEDVNYGNAIKIKEERLEDETLMTLQSSTETAQCQEVSNNRNVSHARHDADDQMKTCSICGVIFGNRRKLEYHELVSHTEPKYKCSYCSLRFHLRYIQRRHEKVHSNTKIKVKKVSSATCELCSKTFRNKWVLRRHIDRAHLQSELVCNKCNLKFASHQKFNRHMKRCHTEPRFKCPHCGKPYHLQYALRKHMAVCLKAKRKRMRKNMEMSEQVVDDDLAQHQSTSLQNVKSEHLDLENESEIKDEDPSETCSICGLIFENRRKLEYHNLVIHTEPQHKCSHCPKRFHLMYVLRRHENAHSEILEGKDLSETCPTCGLIFENRRRLEYHNLVVHTKPQHKCSHCPKMFHLKFMMRRHEKSHIKILEKDISCDKCDLMFTTQKKLSFHVKKIHTEGGFKCPDCGKLYNSQYALGRHMAVHLNPKQKRMKKSMEMANQIKDCTKCGVTFSTRRKLEYHTLVSHTEPKYKCSHCSLNFHLRYILRRHEKVHTKIKIKDTEAKKATCELCSKTFRDKWVLRNHLNRAHPQSELLCNKCNLEFPSYQKFSRHMKRFHTKPRFKCPHCGKPYNLRYALRKHMAFCLRAKRKRMRENMEMSKQEVVDDDLAQIQSSALQNVESEHSDLEYEIEIKDECLEDEGPSEACSICGLIFENRRRLEYHNLVIHTEPQHKCLRCPKIFHLKYMLRRHEQSHSKILEGEGSVECNMCSISFPDKTGLQRHITNVHPPLEISCDKCDLKFTTRYKLSYHVNKVHTEGVFKCPDCGNLYSNQYALRRHMAIHLKANQNSKKESTEMADQQNVVSERLDHKNGIEIKKDQPKLCPICGLNIIGNMEYHKLTAHTEPKHKCSHCPKMFYSISKLNHHEATHSEIIERNVVCKLCPKTFRNEYGLQRHVNLTHPASELPCSMCDLKFLTHPKLYYHVNTIHKPRFKCPECERPFHAPYALRNHMSVHSKAKRCRRSKIKGKKPTTDDSTRRGSKKKKKMPSSDDSERRRPKAKVKKPTSDDSECRRSKRLSVKS